MSATVKCQMWLVSTDDGVAPNTETVQISGSQGLPIVGTPMVRAADGYWDVVASNGTKIHGFLTETIDTEKDEGDTIRIVRADTKCLYAIYCENDGSDSAVVQSDVGDRYAITVSTTAGQVGYATLDLNDTSNAVLSLVDLMANRESIKYSLSDNPGVALVRLDATVIASS